MSRLPDHLDGPDGLLGPGGTHALQGVSPNETGVSIPVDRGDAWSPQAPTYQTSADPAFAMGGRRARPSEKGRHVIRERKQSTYEHDEPPSSCVLPGSRG